MRRIPRIIYIKTFSQMDFSELTMRDNKERNIDQSEWDWERERESKGQREGIFFWEFDEWELKHSVFRTEERDSLWLTKKFQKNGMKKERFNLEPGRESENCDDIKLGEIEMKNLTVARGTEERIK